MRGACGTGVWTCAPGAGAGVAALWALPRAPYWATVSLYVAMGWLGGVPVVRYYRAVGWRAMNWVLAGGVLTPVPFPGQTVSLFNPATGERAEVVSDAAGEYEFGNLPAGAYELEVWSSAYVPPDLRHVTPVTLTAGAVTAGADFVVYTAYTDDPPAAPGGFSLWGSVTAVHTITFGQEETQLVAGQTVVLRSTSNSRLWGYVTTDGDGNFVFPSLPAGDYTLAVPGFGTVQIVGLPGATVAVPTGSGGSVAVLRCPVDALPVAPRPYPAPDAGVIRGSLYHFPLWPLPLGLWNPADVTHIGGVRVELYRGAALADLADQVAHAVDYRGERAMIVLDDAECLHGLSS